MRKKQLNNWKKKLIINKKDAKMYTRLRKIFIAILEF